MSPRWSNGSWSLVQVVGVPNSLHSIHVAAVDVAGNVDATAASVTVLVDTTPPSTEVVSQPPVAVNSTSVSIAVRSFDETPGLVLGFAVDRTLAMPSLPAFVAVTGDMSVSASVSASGLVDGSYSIRLRAVNVLGMVDRVGVTVSVTVDTTPPSASFVGVAAMPIVGSNSSVTVQVAGSDALTQVTLWLSCDGLPSARADAENVSFTDLSDGRHVWHVYGVDAAGNVSPPPLDSVSTIVDTAAPSTWLPRPPPPYSRNASEVEVCVSDANSVTSSVLLNGSVAWSGVTVGSVDGGSVVTRCVNVSVGSDGVYELVSSCVDVAGHVCKNASASFMLDRSPPSVKFTARLPTIVSSSAVSLQSQIGASLSPVAVFMRLDSGLWMQVTNSSVSDVSFTDLSDGRHVWHVYGVDAAGNVSPSPLDSVSTIVDTVPPSTWLPRPPPPYSRNASEVEVCVSDANSVTSSVLLNGSVAWSGVTVGSVDGGSVATRCVNVSMGGDGVFDVVSTCVDTAGHVCTNASASFVLDRSPPTCSLAATPRFVSSRSISIAWSASDSLLPVSVSYRHVNSSVAADMQRRCWKHGVVAVCCEHVC